MTTKLSHHFRNGQRIERQETTNSDGSRTIVDRQVTGARSRIVREIEVSKTGVSTIKTWK